LSFCKGRSPVSAGILALLAMVALRAPALFAQTPASPDGGLMPFAVGERLVYRVEWNPPWYLFFLPKMEAGELELSIPEEIPYNDRKALKIVFKARSSGALASLGGLKVEDDAEFITDSETLCTYAVAKRIREGKRKRDIKVSYLPAERRLHIYELDVSVNPPKAKRNEYRNDIPECVRDPFSALYMTRRRELRAGDVYRSIVGDNDRVKEIETRIEKKEAVETPAGRFESWRINTVALIGGLFREGGTFRIWITADEKKMPVQFEAKVSLGTVFGKLKSNQPSR
jgi:hypothetical protein